MTFTSKASCGRTTERVNRVQPSVVVGVALVEECPEVLLHVIRVHLHRARLSSDIHLNALNNSDDRMYL
jgi:hypothetical protein